MYWHTRKRTEAEENKVYEVKDIATRIRRDSLRCTDYTFNFLKTLQCLLSNQERCHVSRFTTSNYLLNNVESKFWATDLSFFTFTVQLFILQFIAISFIVFENSWLSLGKELMTKCDRPRNKKKQSALENFPMLSKGFWQP